MTSDISFLNNDTNFFKVNESSKNYEDYKNYSEEELLEKFFDGELTIDNRINIINQLYIINLELCMEAINKITSMFQYTPTNIFRNLLKDIVFISTLNLVIKNDCANALYDNNKNLGYECFNLISKEMIKDNNNNNNNIATILQINILRTLIETEKYYNETLEIFSTILLNEKLECDYRYKILLTIQRDKDRKYIEKYLDELYYIFVKNTKTYTRYRILASQYILQKNPKDDKNKDEIEKICIGFACDNNLDYDLRADAADLLVRMGNTESKEIGRDVITLLGRNLNGLSTVYNNRQNVHNEKIEENIKRFILVLAGKNAKIVDNKLVTFENIKEEIIKLTKDMDKNNIDKINSSLLRISIDQTIYDGNQSLQSIFVKVWTIIEEHKYKDELKKRAINELEDMANTCTSGHVSRIVNIFSGYFIEGEEDNNIGNIGFKKQIESNLIARLNKKIKDLKDEDKRDTLLDEMISSGDITNKPTLLEFFRDNLLGIRDELSMEFKNYITDDEFEEYFRAAISFFETGE